MNKFPFIAIIGSADLGSADGPEPRYDPPLSDAPAARQAAVELGQEFARAGFGLIIYSADEAFIERSVLRGFLDAKPRHDRCVRLYSHDDQELKKLDLSPEQKRYFEEPRVSKSDHWEVSFYRSLWESDGMLLIGGRISTLSAGLVGIANRIPLFAVACFGGKTRIVHESLTVGEDLPNRDDVDLMSRPWTSGMAPACVLSLKGQSMRKMVADAGDAIWPARIASGLVAVALTLVAISWFRIDPGTLALFLAPLLAGAAGAIVRVIIGPSWSFRRATWSSIEVAGHLGGIAGGIVALLFVAAQLSAMPSLSAAGDDDAFGSVVRLIPFSIAAAFIAGLTLDRVLRRLLKIDALQRGNPAGTE